MIADIEWTVGAATDRILAFADHLVLPLAFAQEYTGYGDPAMILDKLWSGDRSAVVLTDGERGTYFRQKGDTVRWHVPAYQVQATATGYGLSLFTSQSVTTPSEHAAARQAIFVRCLVIQLLNEIGD